MDLNFKVMGEGKPVIVLHGLFGMLDNWQTFGRQLADEGFMVFLVDLPNHGRSPRTTRFSYPETSEILLDWMHGQSIYHSSILGHSMGGKVAMKLALSNPAAVDKVVVVDIAPRAYPPGHETIIGALGSVDLLTAANRSDVEAQLMGQIGNSRVVQFLMKNLARRREGGFKWKMNLALLSEEYDEIISAVDCISPYNGPALFVRGERSDYVGNDDLAGIRKLFPQAQLRTISGAGHWVHVDNGLELLHTTIEFLEN